MASVLACSWIADFQGCSEWFLLQGCGLCVSDVAARGVVVRTPVIESGDAAPGCLHVADGLKGHEACSCLY
jgi:hypothetical protein